MFKKIVSFLLFLLAQNFTAQTIKGKIIDTDNKQAIPFAIIALEGTNKGITADLDGNFEIKIPAGVLNIDVQVIGYTKKIIPVLELNDTKINIIKLIGNSIELFEIVVRPKENPAIPIIKNVLKNKPIFNIENLPYYFCSTYAKTYFTLSDKTGDENFYKKGDAKDSLSKFLDKSYLFFMESVTEKKYKYKNISQEKVTASRVSGFKSSPFGAFASQLQSFTFYADNIELLDLKYVNPLSKGTFKRYNFEITDTVLNDADTTIIIKFYPKKKSNFKGLKGLLYINKNQYALANVLAEPAEKPSDGNGIKIQQLYERVDSSHWFPKQVNTEIFFYGLTVNGKKDDDKKGQVIKGVSRMYIKDIKLDSAIKIRHKSISVYNEEGFDKKNEAYWNSKRIDTLSEKEITTYQLIDSVGRAADLDKKFKWFTALTTGKFQMGYFNIDLKHIVRANDYENIRLGIGISTSNKLSRWYSVGGYGGYGFKDKAFKYGGFAQINLNWRQSTFLLAEAAHEVMESAGTSFLNESQSLINTEKIRDLLVSRMDIVNFAKGSFNTNLFNFIRMSAYYKVEQRQSPFGYATAQDNLLLNEKNNFTLNEAGIQFKIYPKEKFAEGMGQLISLGSKWPKFSINLVKGLNITSLGYKGDFDYTKLDLKIDHQVYFKVKGFISYQLQAGKVFGSVPYSLQYNNKGSRIDKYSLSAEKTFETMYLNEFISTQYAAFFFAINSGKIVKPNKYCNPELELIHNYGIGTLDNRQNLTNIELNDISKGFTETGLRIKNIYKSKFSSFGAGVYYRYGNYAYENKNNNIVYKLVLGVSF
ncbi:MAG: carboxypeptidase-like regulatory domain-containing protein [Bacteroidetes bacterium]|nr:carboxypeptidase-like regulatory domain-containing protein [Bacteroidota bacterium]